MPASRSSKTSAPTVHSQDVSFTCSTQSNGRHGTWVRAHGEIDLATAPTLAQALGDALELSRLVVVDFGEVTFFDSSGIHCLVDATAAAHRAGGRLVVLRPPPAMQDILHRATMTDQIECFELDLET